MPKASLFLPLVLAAHAWGQEPTGGEIQISPDGPGFQVQPSLAACASGNFIVAWSSEGSDGSDFAVMARRYGPGGQPEGPEFQVNAYTLGAQALPSVACSSSGRFVIVWQSWQQDGDGWGVYGRRFDAQGQPRGSEFRVNQHTVDSQETARVMIDPSGDLVVVWQSLRQDGSDWGVYGRRYRGNGAALGPEFRINETTVWSQTEPALAAAPDGGFLVAWSSWKQDGQGYGVFARRYAPSGQPTGPEFQVNTTTAYFQDRPSVAYEGEGGFIITWEGLGPFGLPEVFAQRYGPGGTPVGTELTVNADPTDWHMRPVVAGQPQGAVVVWSNRDQSGVEHRILGQRLGPHGEKVGPEFVANADPLGNQDEATVATDVDGNFFVAWYGPESANPDDTAVFGRTYEFTYDLGDAPRTYPTLRANDGARHLQPSQLYLGGAVSAEPDGQPAPRADQDDDDGVTFASAVTTAGVARVEVAASGTGRLDAWVDWNRDGDWDDPGEQALANVEVGAGGNSLNIAVPPTASAGTTVARFRLSSSGGLSSHGLAADGEVEDLEVAVEPVGISISDASVVEGDAGVQNAVFAVALAWPSPSKVSVVYATREATADPNGDYLERAGLLVFPPGATRKTLSVPVWGDFTLEPDEHFEVELTAATNATLLDATAVGTIVNDDSPGTLQISAGSYSVAEAAAQLLVSVERTEGAGDAVSVSYATGHGSADETDYSETTGVLAFEGGVLVKTFAVPLVADHVREGPETFLVQLLSPTAGATLGPQSTAVATIADDDLLPVVQLRASSFRAFEKSRAVSVSVTRSQSARGWISIDYSTSDGSAHAPGDYGTSSGTLSFPEGVMTRTVVVPIVDDSLPEGSEAARVTLSNPLGAVLGPLTSAQIEIVDNDQPPVLAFAAAEFKAGEGAGGVLVTVTRTGSLAGTVSVTLATSDESASSPTDYEGASVGLTFSPGVRAKTFRVKLADDLLVEGTETVGVALSAPVAATLGVLSQARLLIVDDESTVRLERGATSISEGASSATLTIVRGGPLNAPASVEYSVLGGTALPNLDFVPGSGQLTFPTGVAARTVEVTLLNDSIEEGDETILVSLSSPSPGLGLGTPALATLRILDDDEAGRVGFSQVGYSLPEGGGNAVVTVVRSGGTAGPATVRYATVGGTATPGEDYAPGAGVLVFAPGETTRTFVVPVAPDSTVEGNESVFLTLSDPAAGLELADSSQATLWIVEPVSH